MIGASCGALTNVCSIFGSAQVLDVSLCVKSKIYVDVFTSVPALDVAPIG